jgi:UDP-N-acetylmuramoylalanine-D-glutamate ligase
MTRATFTVSVENPYPEVLSGQATWVQDQIDLTEFAGRGEVRVRFYMAARGATDSWWAIDDIRIEEAPGDVVLLAPGGTSFDQFSDFEERGEAFRKWVSELS